MTHSVLIALLAGGLWLLAGSPCAAEEPPPPDLTPPSLEIPGLGSVQPLLDYGQGDYVVFTRLSVPDPAQLDLAIVLNYDEDAGSYYLLRLTGQRAELALARGGETRNLVSAPVSAALLPADRQVMLAVRREGWRLSLLLDDRPVLQTYEASLTSGELAWRLSGGEAEEPLVQFLGDVYFEDNFMRTAQDASAWRPVTGQWHQESLREDAQAQTMDVTRSANAFSYLGRINEGRALSVVGYWFWADYRWEVCLRPLGDEPAGIVALYSDPDNYLALRWTSRRGEGPEADRLQIILRRDGEDSVLAQAPGGFWPGQWYRLALAVSDGWVRGYLDGEVRLAARFSGLVQGRAGLFAEGPVGCNFDDVRLSRWGYFAEDFATGRPWVQQGGQWQVGGGRAEAGGKGLLVGPLVQGPLLEASADVNVERGAGGLVFGHRGPGEYYTLRYTPSGREARVELVRTVGGREESLYTATATAAHGGRSATRLDLRLDHNLATASVQGQRLFQVALPSDPSGRLGLYADSPGGVSFNFVESERQEPPPVAHVVKEFLDETEHWEMAAWASRRSIWLIPQGLQVERDGNSILRPFNSPTEFGQHVWWSKGNYFGDKSLSFSLAKVGQVSGTLRATLEAVPGPDGKPQEGITLAVTAQAGSSELRLVLSAPDRGLGETTFAVEGDAAWVEFARVGRFLQVRVNHQLVLQAEVG